MIQGTCPIRTFLQAVTVRVYILFERNIISVKSLATAPVIILLKWERRIEFGMESSRFFDLVRWGEAKDVINAYYVTEAARCSIYKNAGFTENKNEYLPIPFEQISASNGNYTQNFGW